MTWPLEGIRVIDFSRVLAGPHCAKVLGDLGADVVKVEPPRGDLARQAFPREGEISGYYAQQNAGKRNMSIDLNAEAAREVALRLCDTSDVIVENFRPGTLAAFGLDYAAVAARNPTVVYASISGYGQRGPWRNRMAYAPTVQAEAGITSNSSRHFDPGGELRTDALSHADIYAGLHAAIAILAALHRRNVTGEGQYIDVAMAAVMISINERVHVDLSETDLGAERPILGATDCPFFEGPRGETFVSPMSLVGSMSFPLYAAAMRRADLVDDPRFRTPELRLHHREELHQIIQNWIWSFRDMASLDAQLEEAKIATGQVRDVNDLVASEWAEDWEATRRVSDRHGGHVTVPGRPWRFSGATTHPDEQVPARQGEHNDLLLAELGYSPDQITHMQDQGALVEPGRATTTPISAGELEQAASGNGHHDSATGRPVSA